MNRHYVIFALLTLGAHIHAADNKTNTLTVEVDSPEHATFNTPMASALEKQLNAQHKHHAPRSPIVAATQKTEGVHVALIQMKGSLEQLPKQLTPQSKTVAQQIQKTLATLLAAQQQRDTQATKDEKKENKQKARAKMQLHLKCQIPEKLLTDVVEKFSPRSRDDIWAKTEQLVTKKLEIRKSFAPQPETKKQEVNEDSSTTIIQ